MRVIFFIVLLFAIAIAALGSYRAQGAEFGTAATDYEAKVEAQFEELLQQLEGINEELNLIDERIIILNEKIRLLEEGTGGGTEPPPEPEPTICSTVSSVEEGQDPFPGSHGVMPGLIEAEDYDLGGEGVAYHDKNATNSGGQYRTSEGVDIKASSDAAGGFYSIGWGDVGDWVEYTLCLEPGQYDIWLRVACGVDNCGPLKVSLGGEVVGIVPFARTGPAWDTDYATLQLPPYTVQGGHKVMRIEWVGSPGDLNWIQFNKVGEAPAVNHPPTDILLCEANPDGSPNWLTCE